MYEIDEEIIGTQNVIDHSFGIKFCPEQEQSEDMNRFICVIVEFSYLCPVLVASSISPCACDDDD